MNIIILYQNKEELDRIKNYIKIHENILLGNILLGTISLENIIGLDALYISSSILLIALSLVGLGYRDKLLNHKEPELEWNY